MIPIGTYPAGTKLIFNPTRTINDDLLPYKGNTIVALKDFTVFTVGDARSTLLPDKSLPAISDTIYAKHFDLLLELSTIQTDFL